MLPFPATLIGKEGGRVLQCHHGVGILRIPRVDKPGRITQHFKFMTSNSSNPGMKSWAACQSTHPSRF